MKHTFQLAFLAMIAVATPVAGQPSFARGDVVVSAYEEGEVTLESNLRVYGRDGVYKRELVPNQGRFFGEPLVLSGVVFFSTRTPHSIARVRADGTMLPPFTLAVVNVNRLSPGGAGSIIAQNGSGEIYHFDQNGTLLRIRRFGNEFPAYGGIDLARDGCTLIYGLLGAVAQWNVCTGAEPATLLTRGRLGAASYALRILPDGTILAAILTSRGSIFRLDREGNVIREYPIPSPRALALDIDGTSFWTNAGNLLLRVDIGTGTVLSETFTRYQIYGISVVGEPRAAHAATHDIPVASPMMLVALALTIAVVAFLKLRLT